MKDLHWHGHATSRLARVEMNGHRPCTIWFTGLSGSGKSTIANALDGWLHRRGCHTYVLDGDNVRQGLNKDLGFSEQDRVENIRRVGEVAKLFNDAGLIVSCAFISPYEKDRHLVRQLLNEDEYVEVFLSTSLADCERRDPKGLYRKARAGELANFTGIDSPYEPPVRPNLAFDTSTHTVNEVVGAIFDYLVAKGIVRQHGAVGRASVG
ncbi:adenylyl-sulfate kinase [Pseudomonas entomophila]|uniref:Adenylyl-sulfate kinase n=2 Tax=Pseudomonas entomophila TaxID=312306 RepID=CYSC_PSEE4|nr:adenylyl-sulfate kinase [Pseudomonas entomophila]Q1I2K4.1 RecName: Full=Adenylyl-sulfate kinase; AltName: Full=APS kinase; AltName: Full=ATP adenosine-5'-phosphosulfate 3'-phosphotransferase; AltName: Full=Adenosine-5'-phosphosulfate kinase [Pseudomonas entomophila L48]WMW06184.1 adenylyl-sulfate kinase [Pseudomonas entomophila]CAK18132.1 adenosine 5'-phosphosulfate kinase [Pseudomonas entomophila L48]